MLSGNFQTMNQPTVSSHTATTKLSGYLSLAVATLVAVAGLLLASRLDHSGLANSSYTDSQSSVDVVDTSKNVTYRGLRNVDVEHFQNIFYGQDTSGTNRFAPPIPYVPNPGSIIDATSPGAWCPQAMGGPPLPFTSSVTNTSENCLSLRIARPRGTKPSSGLPVIIWIHGGGHALGSASDVLYTPDGLIQLSVANKQPTIFVGINYRLGIFGFAMTETLLKAKETNAGLRDQRAAFEWVRNNIDVFGGDPNRVTVIGQSVGSSGIGHHLLSFDGQKGVPFDQAVMMSGAPATIFNTKNGKVTERTALVANELGCVKDGNPNSAATLKCLRETSFEVLMNKSVELMRLARPPFGEAFFHPTYDNDYITDYPSELVRGGKLVKDIPLIVSWVTNEGAWYAPPTTSSDEEVAATIALWMDLSPESLDHFLSLYPLSDFVHLAPPDSQISAQYYRAAQMNRDVWFTCPALDFSWHYAKISGVGNVRLYEFNQTRFGPVFESIGVPFWGVGHLSDIPYVLNIDHLPGGVDSSTEQLALATKMCGDIISFANQKPEPDGKGRALDYWLPAYSGHSDEELKSEFPQRLAINLLGGPHGNGMVSVVRNEIALDEGQKAIEYEKLFERCDFLNSAKSRMQASV